MPRNTHNAVTSARSTARAPDLYDAASAAVHRLGVAILLLRRLDNAPEDEHGGYTQDVVQDVIQRCREDLTAAMKTAEQEQAKARAAAKKDGAR